MSILGFLAKRPWRLLLCRKIVLPETRRHDPLEIARRLKQCRDVDHARRLHQELALLGQDRDTFLGNHLVQMYGSLGCVDEAAEAFDRIRHPNVFSWNMILVAFTRNGRMQQAWDAFDKVPRKDVVTWTVMITACAQQDELEAISLFRKMELQGFRPDAAAFLGVLDACANLAAFAQNGHALGLAQGERIHHIVVDSGLDDDVFVGSALINMYGKCREVPRAKLVFDRLPLHNVVSWTALLAAFAQNGHLDEASLLFLRMPHRDTVAWNSLIAAHYSCGECREALELYKVMSSQGISAGQGTYVSIIEACAKLPSLEEGKRVHASLNATELRSSATIQNALINMYGRCGEVQQASGIFSSMRSRCVISWTSLITAFAQHGHSERAMELFQAMCLDGVEPNQVTLTSLLASCHHTGLIDDGVYYFSCLHLEYGIPAMLEHYTWILDVLGHSGQLDRAEELIHGMPFEPGAIAWKMLLAACQIHGDLERASRVAGIISSRSNSKDSAPFVLLSNMVLTQSFREL